MVGCSATVVAPPQLAGGAQRPQTHLHGNSSRSIADSGRQQRLDGCLGMPRCACARACVLCAGLLFFSNLLIVLHFFIQKCTSKIQRAGDRRVANSSRVAIKDHKAS